MDNKTKIVLASLNPGKITELTHLLEPLGLTIVSQAELGVPEIEETGVTFIENALLKARHVSQLTGLSAIADDSGLVVPHLNGEPGIYSARYAGIKASSEENINKLLTALEAVKQQDRKAFFYCALVYIAHAHDPVPLVAEGKWQGVITDKAQGKDGFGYDPIFYVAEENKTAAELPLNLKNKISHRGMALKRLIKKLKVSV